MYVYQSMSSVRTSASFYRRGVPNSFKDFGQIARGNYTVFQPSRPGYYSPFFKRSISNFISVLK